MNITQRSNIESKTEQQAKRWLLLHANEISEAQRVEFAQWCQQDKANQQEYLRIEELWNELDLVGDEILNQYSGELDEYTARKSLIPWRSWALAASIAVLVVGFYPFWWTGSPEYTSLPPQTFSSTTGAIKSLTLEDGSELELAPESMVIVSFDKDKRAIVLSQGEAYFKVAKSSERPFIVSAAGAQVRAVGTEFNIYLGSRGAAVTVHEGRVEVTAESQYVHSTVADLAVGDSVLYSPSSGLSPVVSTDLSLSAGWREGMMIFNSKPLKDVVADLNRYHIKNITISDKRLDSIEVNGVFKAGESEAVLRAIQSSLPAEVVRYNGLIELRYKEVPKS